MIPSNDAMSRYSVTSASGDVVATSESRSSAHRASRRQENVGGKVSANRAGGKVKEIATRYVGNCQACEGDFKLYSVVSGEPKDDDLRMVHHGYQRPGHGYIVGDCPGVGEKPYERSKERVERMLSGAKRSLQEARERLLAMQAGEVRTLTELDWRGKRLVEYVVGVTDPREWRSALDRAISQTEHRIRELDTATIPRLSRRVEQWRLRPVRTIEEEVQKAAAVKAVREEEKAKKREAKMAKEAATQARKQAAEDKRDAIRRDIAAKFLAFDAAGDKVGAMAYTRKLKKYSNWLYYGADSLGIDDVLRRLGVAYRAAHNQKLYWVDGAFG